jgi:hypothetical protein
MLATVPLPTLGSVVRVRQRSWLVTEVVAPAIPHQSGLVRLACLDDDDAGEPLQVLWSHELDAELPSAEPELIRASAELDPPALFGAYLHAIRWNTVTSTDARLLQAPFRAGIDLKPYQLEPLRKALELPRVNLFIADDVGLGKTIEAGLVIQEMVLRQRIDRILVICPPAVTMQWQEEMAQRFGLAFAIYDRAFIAARRRERGFGVNPWTTHPRMIVSYALLRGARGRSSGAKHLELLLRALGERSPRTLLVLDECHQVAPAGGALYPIDTRTTRAVRQVSERVGHRLFLSATPHNGHSQSFSALLHLLDPQRFTRGVPVRSPDELAPVMVRRLKRHLRSHVSGLPERRLVDHPIRLGAESAEVRLGQLLAEYEAVYRASLGNLPERQRLARSLVVVNLHKRLLSSVHAFHHTLQLHLRGANQALAGAPEIAPPVARGHEDDERSEEEIDDAEDLFIAEASVDAGARAAQLRHTMLQIASEARSRPDARVAALAAWVNENLCPGGRYNQRRLVVFTEYEDTLSWLIRVLPPLLLNPRPDAIERFSGRLGDEQRERLKATFNRPPSQHPLRILLCTDAAREGINLQAHCADLFHFDLPWNPSRLEQRNGRIDRVLQPETEVRCHYFDCLDRPEDRVLTYLVSKLEVIREELGSLSAVVSDRIAARLELGLRDGADGRLIDEAELRRLTDPGEQARAAQRELEGQGAALLQGDLSILERQLERSQRRVDYRWEHLRELVDLGLRSVSGEGLRGPLPAVPGAAADAPQAWSLPPLDDSWAPILDLMREPEVEREGDSRWAPPPPIRPVTFRAAHRLDAPAVQLHLGHPLVKRLVGRFRAQGTARHDLSRLTLVENSRDNSRRLVLFGRLSLFGEGATRLHEELIAFTAQVRDGAPEPFAEGGAGEATTLERLGEALAHAPQPHPNRLVRSIVLARAAQDFRALAGPLRDRGAAAALRARALLRERGQREGEALTLLLRRQRQSILDQFEEFRQTRFGVVLGAIEERDQFERDRRFMEKRLLDIETELETEPAAIEASYAVALERFEPIGLAYLWPSS